MKIISTYQFFILAAIIFVPGCNINVNPEEANRVIDLSGKWKFTIGDNTKWSEPDLNDDNWEEITVPSAWEDQGFHGYNGYAWYRKQLTISSHLKGQALYLHLGFVDDVDETYLNGNLIGSTGIFPPNYSTAYNAYRRYYLPEHYINFDGDNIISVRVYDAELSGGIISGQIGIFTLGNVPETEISLEGNWRFNTGDDLQRKEIFYDDSDWSSIIVPGTWETQGFPDYDGFAWYRRKFTLDEKYKDVLFVLVMGKIDDIDEVYLNGEMIGSTGDMNSEPIVFNRYNEWAQLRGYYVPAGLLKFNEENLIAVRVYDGYLGGGIYEGPVGLVKQNKYREFWIKKTGN